jgi:hypothetical protein
MDNLNLEYRPEDWDYDPNDRNQRHILVVPPGVDIWQASCDHWLRMEGGGNFVCFAEPGETPRETVARYRAFECADMARDRTRELAGKD